MLWSWINVHYIQQVHTLDYWSLKSKDDHIYTYMHNAFHTLSTFNANKVKKRKKKIMIPIYSNHLFHFYILQEPILLKKGRNPCFDFLRLFIPSSSYGHLPLPHHIHNTPRASTWIFFFSVYGFRYHYHHVVWS